ncbi:copper homeostasis protein CutC [Ligilactobacillus ceti]|uniref:Copper homeostasis protein cutC homolog n=1 Tax=Ligilactobacillus ceti DSM 22408 TaxID=1122146 RepID=A0A0R2KR24_9LACO|nr:copper homeostasis protein CutC [Ligilactobacillus ceti]KRN89340.1 copper homeostasis protein CutC [Ligilactobacillus ceti DSM 22408]
MIYTELCIQDFAGAQIAANNGFNSVEINSALFLGGLTPSLGLVQEICSQFPDLDKMAMLRNRGAGFCYSDSEFQTLCRDLDLFLKTDLTGIVFGFLLPNGQIDQVKTAFFVNKIHAAGKKAIFHRAFDNTPDPQQALQTLIDLNVDRVLSSGQQPTAIAGAPLLADLINKYQSQIEIICGSGLNAANIASFIQTTHAQFVHSTCKNISSDPTTTLNVSYAYLPTMNSGDFLSTDPNQARDFINNVHKL